MGHLRARAFTARSDDVENCPAGACRDPTAVCLQAEDDEGWTIVRIVSAIVPPATDGVNLRPYPVSISGLTVGGGNVTIAFILTIPVMVVVCPVTGTMLTVAPVSRTRLETTHCPATTTPPAQRPFAVPMRR